jgi:hypothetical protein
MPPQFGIIGQLDGSLLSALAQLTCSARLQSPGDAPEQVGGIG